MRKIGLMLVAAAALSIAAPANAVTVNYQFGGVGSGTMALDNTAPGVYSLLTLNMTLGSANFTQANSGISGSGSNYLLGSMNPGCGLGFLGAACSNQNSFFLIFDPALSSQTALPFFWSQVGDILHPNDTLTLTQYTPTGGVPEPGTWAMMLLGFGGIGLAIRRRRRPLLA